MSETILSVKDLKTYFFTDHGVVKAVDGVDLELKKGTTLGIVGESGSGKSVTSLSVMHLLNGTQGKIVGGEMVLDGNDILHLNAEEQRKLRGNQIAMIFQGADDFAEPRFENWGPDHGRAHSAPEIKQSGGQDESHRHLEKNRDFQS